MISRCYLNLIHDILQKVEPWNYLLIGTMKLSMLADTHLLSSETRANIMNCSRIHMEILL